MPSYSIVVLCHGHRAVTERCLNSLGAAYGERLGDDVELVLVDNASPDDTPELLRAWEDRATLVLSERNLNYAGGNNAGVRSATGEVIVLLNNDTELLDDVLDGLVEQALEPGVGIVGCRLLYANGTIQHGGCAWRRAPEGVLPFHLFQYESGDLAAAGAIYEGDAVTGACLAIRRSLYLELDGLDEAFVNGLEDMDMCIRARVAGHTVVYRGDIAVVHHEGATRSRRPNDVRNQELFLARYAAVAEVDTARFAEQFGAVETEALIGLYAGDSAIGTGVSVEGEVGGLAPESAEGRALMAGLEAAGFEPAMREWRPRYLRAPLDDFEARLLKLGQLRSRRRGALIVQSPVGRLGAIDAHPHAILRLAEPLNVNLRSAAAVWAAYPDLAERLIASGLDAGQVDVLPPPIPDVPLGNGGEGVLIVLPGHDLVRCRELLTAAAQVAGSRRVRLVPTVATERLAAVAGAVLPHAELLKPISTETAFARLSGDCDVVVHADPRDRFERRALIAGAAGSTVVHLPEGTAASILGRELGFKGSADVLDDALTRRPARRANAERVRAACGPQATSQALRALVAHAVERLPAEQCVLAPAGSHSGLAA